MHELVGLGDDAVWYPCHGLRFKRFRVESMAVVVLQQLVLV